MRPDRLGSNPGQGGFVEGRGRSVDHATDGPAIGGGGVARRRADSARAGRGRGRLALVRSAGPPDHRDHRGRPRRGGEVQGHRIRRADHHPRLPPQGHLQPLRRHDDGHASRRPPGRPDLLPAPCVRTARLDEVSPRGGLGLRRRADAHIRRRQLREHPPGPLAAPGHRSRAQLAAGALPGSTSRSRSTSAGARRSTLT